MLNNKSIMVVMPAYRAAKTLAATWEAIPHDIVDQVLLVDDASDDETVSKAHGLGIPVVLHESNRGYGSNQKPATPWRWSRVRISWSCCILIINTNPAWYPPWPA